MEKKYSALKAERVTGALLKICSVFLLLIYFNKTSAQEPLVCGGYKINKDAVQKARDFETHNLAGIQNASFQVRICFHIVTYNDGSNPSATLAQVATEFNTLNADYAPAGICFINEGINFVNNTQLDTNYNADNGPASAFNLYVLPDCINIFYLNKIKGSNGACAGSCGYGGYTLFLPGTISLVATGNLGGHTTSHETGHCLGLLHPFETAYGYEDINGSNSATAGDLVGDTPADPYAYIGQSCFSQSKNKCLYTGSCADPNGQKNFQPPYANTMSYWSNYGCYPNVSFTKGQFTRAKSTLGSYSPLIYCQSSTTALTEGPNLTIASQGFVASTISTLTTTGAVTISGNSVVRLAGKSVVLGPGFQATTSGSGAVWIQTITPCAGGTGGVIKSAMARDAESIGTAEHNTLIVYPNPSSSSANIAITLEHAQKNVVLQLYDLNGRRLKEINLTNLPAGARNIPLSVSGFSPGVYYLSVRLNDAILNTKIMVAR